MHMMWGLICCVVTIVGAIRDSEDSRRKQTVKAVGSYARDTIFEVGNLESEKRKQLIGNASRKSKRMRIADSDRTAVFLEWHPPQFRIRVGPVRDVAAAHDALSLLEMDSDGAIPTLMATSAVQMDEIEEQTEFSNCRGGGRRLALTFDDGPRGENTLNVVNAMQDKGAVGTFFELGASWGTNCEKHENYDWCGALWTSMLKNGNTLGYHNYVHNAISDTSKDISYVEEQTKHAQLAFARVLGHHPLLFRPPNGATGVGSVGHTFFKSLGYKFINWNLHTWDWSYVDQTPPNSPEVHKIVDLFARELKGGTPYIALMHDTDSFQWMKFFPEMLDTIRSAGYTFENMETCLEITEQDEVYAPEGLGYKRPNAGSCEPGWQLYLGPKVKPDMFKPICIAQGICKSWGYYEHDGVCHADPP